LSSRQPSYDFITIRSGLLNTQVSHLALTEDELFAFYTNSFSIISTSEKSQINHTPTFYIKSLKVNSEPRDYTKVLSLPYNQNNIRLDFGFISFNHQEIRTRYRLDKTASWNELTERTIDLYSLSPGSYALDLQYSLDGIHWTKILQMPVINISPPWWQTIKFVIVAIVGIAFVVFLFFYNRLVIYRQRVEKMKLLGRQQEQLIRTEMDTLERERGRIAKDLHDSVGTNILATKLTVSRLLKKHNDPESESVETQFHDTLREIKEIIYDLYPPDLERYGLATGIKNYVDRIASSTTVKFNVNTFGSALLDVKICVPLYRVLQELITNSLKHSQAKSISIHLNSFDDLYNIVYEDTGTGFSMTDSHKGLGLHSIESRIKAINGKITFQSGPIGVSYSIDVPIRKVVQP
jgi:signal transduction histidine kinase